MPAEVMSQEINDIACSILDLDDIVEILKETYH